jgi:glucose-6-phosphate isomerase
MKILEGEKLLKRYRKHLWTSAKLGMALDISRMGFSERLWNHMEPAMQRAFDAMARLESGEVANPDEDRMVGHYWLRAPHLAPTDELGEEIQRTIDAVADFARRVHTRQLKPDKGQRFTDVLLIGIGGSALGPQLVADALAARRDKLKVHFLDNTDPDGIQRTLESIQTRLKSTIALVVSKSGGTPETANGMIEAREAYEARHLEFHKQAVAITGKGSKLDQLAEREGWLARFPMWDWVGGRTSITGAVGLVPAALQGIDIRQFLAGAAEMDRLTRVHQTKRNPAAKLALMWYDATNARGEKDMVVLPYKDRLLLFSRYLQQLIMESLGKSEDLDGRRVEQGLAVYGNKGSTDQHAYVQQLREGVNNFFATFVVVLQDHTQRNATSVEVEPGVTSGDYLNGFWQGTRQALYENGRASMTITLDKLDARTLGALIALYERAVGLYAYLVNINAYHQPGVEAGKKAAAAILDLQKKVVAELARRPDEVVTPDLLAEAMGDDRVEAIEHVLNHLAANRRFVQTRRRAFQYLPPRR